MTIVRSLIIGGVYRHNKTGNEYIVKAVANSSEDLSKLVIYQSLKDNVYWARPIQEFLDIPIFDKDIDTNDPNVYRFSFVKMLGNKNCNSDVYIQTIEL